MQQSLQVSFRNIEHSDAVEMAIRQRVERIERFFGSITGCRVVVEFENRRHRQGNLFHVRVDLTVPGEEIVVARSSGNHHAHENVYVAIRDTFLAVERQLKNYVRKRRVRVHEKGHVGPLHGKVVRLCYEDGGYGFIQTEDGREIYFNKNSVLNGNFDQLQLGDEVRYAEEAGEEGPQASTVDLVGKGGGQFLRRF